jgi:hypothetical protein
MTTEMTTYNKEEVEEMYSDIKFEENDLGMSWIHKGEFITPFNETELILQLSNWVNVQSTGRFTFSCREENNIEVKTEDGKTWYILVVQQLYPNGKMIEIPLCIMSYMLFGVLINGYVSAFKSKFWRDITFKYIKNFHNTINFISSNPDKQDEYMIKLLQEIITEETKIKNKKQAEEMVLTFMQEKKNKEEQDRLEAKRLEEAKVKADEANAKLLADLEAEENKKSSPKKKKEKKPKQPKVAVNPHKKEIRVSEGIWKPNPAWKKWEQENKQSASP